MQVIENEREKSIRYTDMYKGKPRMKVVRGVYNAQEDITFIMQDKYDPITKWVIETEVIGFYYGSPELRYIKQYSGKLVAYF